MPDMVKKTVKLTKDPSGASATDIGALGDQHVSLQKTAQKAQVSLSKRGLDGIRLQVALFLDYSGSMYYNYKNGSVQKIVERALGFALNVDADGSIPVYGFDDSLFGPFDVNVGTYQGVVEREIMQEDAPGGFLGRGKKRDRPMGGTTMAPVFKTAIQLSEKSDAPLVVIVVGDGSPGDRRATTQAAIESAGYPVWIKFLSVLPVDYLQELDDLPASARAVDNFDTKPGEDDKPILEMSDLEFADAMTDELQSWITAATAAGILT
jgi:hypothetical protein